MSLHSFSHDSWHILAATKGFAQNVSACGTELKSFTIQWFMNMIQPLLTFLHSLSNSSVIIAHCDHYCTPMWPHPAPEWEQPASLVTTLVPLCTPLSLSPEYPLNSAGQLLPSASCYYQQARAQFSSPLLPPLVADTGHMTTGLIW